MKSKLLALQYYPKIAVVLVAALLIRLLSLALYPLMDTTEARYGEMARLMSETGNWLTPQFDYGVPFWGKPPLQNWLSASFIELFSNNEFFLRLPHFLVGLVVLLLVVKLAKTFAINGFKVATMLTTTVAFYVCMGTVMTDMGLLLGLTLAFVSFYLAWQGQYLWGYLGFIGLAIGLMAKGPVAIAIFGIATFLWLLWTLGPIKMWAQLWLRIPLFTGLLLLLALTMPWYVMAEQATPGFIQYFIVGEHWSRFVDSGWKGDLYGSAHDEVRGTIWIYFVAACVPWSLFIPRGLYRLYQKANVLIEQKARQETGHEASQATEEYQQKGFDDFTKFLLCWMAAPLILFTFAGNILPAYVLPATPALALLIAYAWRNQQISQFVMISSSIPLLLITALVVLNSGVSKEKSDKWLLNQRVFDLPVYYWFKQPFSSRYYSEGKAVVVNDEEQLQQLNLRPYYIVVSKQQLKEQDVLESCLLESETRKKVLILCGEH
ncbi:glycosyltransferase family 39 protein [Shewanella sp. 10N.7]|uniref:ArnT family glycosyltransferase n=1 Tax=Shewanella sp. 10N.7 TaxID=2885093 RepID=UPI001E58BA38|nr:glycosyltransferase family 39 protein [Shewanella sp. 10N.7]MCC4833687.1 glycosyltransferase family 39 protein [Shewanella sp. 10N.7]